MKASITIACDTAIIDGRNNRISLLNVLDEVHSTTFPFVIGTQTVLCLTIKEPSDPETYDLDFRATIDGEEVLKFPVKGSFSGKSRNRVLVEMQGVAIPKPGTLVYSFRFQGKELGTWAMVVSSLGNLPPVGARTPTDLVPKTTAAKSTRTRASRKAPKRKAAKK
jgi:hypothetical protein